MRQERVSVVEEKLNRSLTLYNHFDIGEVEKKLILSLVSSCSREVTYITVTIIQVDNLNELQQ